MDKSITTISDERRIKDFKDFNIESWAKRIAEWYIAEIKQEINSNKTPGEKILNIGRNVIVELDIKLNQIEESIKERHSQENLSRDEEENSYIMEWIKDMTENKNEILKMTKEINEDIEEIKNTEVSKERLENYKIKRKEYLKLAKNYPPIQ